MMKSNIVLLILIGIALFSLIGRLYFPSNHSNGNRCCTECTDGNEKTYSIDHVFNHCGESCSKPSLFWLYKIFEPGLIRANSTN